jgi:hypothetical protein
MFKTILSRLGIKVEVIGLESTEGGFHAANIVELDGKYYFFDTTLETTIYNQYREFNEGNIFLCCAGLGQNEYLQFYIPKVVLPDDLNEGLKPLPNNIALDSIPREVTNGLLITPTKKNPII